MGKIYDAIIIGAGPAGLFCAYELINRDIKNIVIIEAGQPLGKKRCSLITSGVCVKCTMCSNLSGYGGSAFFNPGKMSFYPAGSGLKSILKTDEACENKYKYVDSVFSKYGLKLFSTDMEYNYSSDANHSINIKYYRSVPVSKSEFGKFNALFRPSIEDEITIMYESKVEKIIIEKEHFKLNILSNKNVVSLLCKNVVVATGEYGFRWWRNIQEEIKVYSNPSPIDIGVRLECPSSLLSNIWNYHKDMKAKMNMSDGSEVRSYCVLKKGMTIYCNYNDYTVLDGIAVPESKTAGMTIFNRIVPGTNGISDPQNFAVSLLTEFYKVYKKPIVIRMEDFLQSVSTCGDDTVPTLLDVENTVSFDIIPQFIYNNIKDFIIKLNELIPGIISKNNFVYFPVMDNLWRKTEVNAHMETSCHNLFVAGDTCGHMRGIMQACVSGVLCAEGIYNKLKEDT